MLSELQSYTVESKVTSPFFCLLIGSEVVISPCLEVSVDLFPTACLLPVSSLLAAMMVEAGTGAAVDRGPNGFEISAIEMSKQCCHQHC